jgi:GTP 3',8-cyclase
MRMKKQQNILIPQPEEISNCSQPTIVDQFGRTFNYLRIALNEQCNLRCIYCMPKEGISFRNQSQLLSKNEIYRLIEISSQMGISKIRFTGGEPLLRKELIEIIKYANMSGINSTHITTNGLLLGSKIDVLENAGLTGINISLDTLNPEKYKKITRRDGLNIVLQSLDKAIKSGIKSVKVNVVTLKEFNDDEIIDFVEMTKENNITIRFIELMPFDSQQIWKTGKFFSAENILSTIKKQVPNLLKVSGSSTEHHIFQVDGFIGKVAIIPAYSRNLCGNCNRIRVTADGKLLNCLYSQDEINLRDEIRIGKSDFQIEKLIRDAMLKKHKDGWLAQNQGKVNRKSMTQIGG